jgi:hypothetical protein
MDCPYCKKDIYGLTGLQELQAFQKHLRKCKKVPRSPHSLVSPQGKALQVSDNPANMLTALEIRAHSGQ